MRDTPRPFHQPSNGHFPPTTHAILKMIGLEFEREKNRSLSFFLFYFIFGGEGEGWEGHPLILGGGFTWHKFFGLPTIDIFAVDEIVLCFDFQ